MVKMGPSKSLTLHTPWGDFDAGQVFETKTVKGNTNYVLFFFELSFPDGSGYVYYCHGDRAKKVPRHHFIRLVESGDLKPIPVGEEDPERMALASIGLRAMLNGVTFQDYLKAVWNHGEGTQA
ncbi:MAG: hypothetical protein IPN68_10000 [Bacteroidetes bacterium]|nr:hypothetical protein [Bacteroidota bacterium]